MIVLLHRFGMTQARDALIKDPCGERHQRYRIDEGGEHAGAMIPEGLGVIGGFGLQIEPEPGKEQRYRIGEIMAGVGKQCQ